jgi:hypothetical protein
VTSTRTRLPLSTLLLLGANAVPLLGVLFLGWDLFSIMVLYWAENGIIGILNVPKMLLATGEPGGPDTPADTPPAVNVAAKFSIVAFFVLHYGLFWTVHGVFVFALFGPPQGPTTTVAIGVLVLFASHGVSLIVNYVGRGEYLETTPSQQASQPYSRVVVLHFTVLGGGFLTLLLGAPVAALALLVILKTAFDLRYHLREHRMAAAK